MQLKEQTIRGIPTVNVVADFLRLLKKRLEPCFSEQTNGKSLSSFKVRWCLTLPAIWNDQQKAIMNKAAFAAGLSTSLDAISSGELVLVLEPEAAAAHFTDYVPEHLKVDPNNKVVLVVDGGGGTVDLAAHRVVLEGTQLQLEELVPGDGNILGGERINDLFNARFKRQFEQQAMKANVETNPIAWHRLESEFENHKCRLSPGTTNALEVTIAQSIYKLPRNPNVSEDDKLTFLEDEDETGVRLQRADIDQFFAKTLDGMKSLVESMVDRLKKNNINIDYIFLVGGLSESKIFQESVASFGKSLGYTVIWPNSPESAIVDGALHFGRMLNFVKTRVLKYTYGVGTTAKWNDDRHKGKKKFFVDSQALCDYVFSKLEVAEAVVAWDKPVSRIYYPLYTTQTSIRMEFFRYEGEGKGLTLLQFNIESHNNSATFY